MILKVFDMMKARWPEVMLIWVLQAALLLLGIEVERRWSVTSLSETPPAPEWAMFFLAMGIAWISLVLYMLLLGFLKTAIMEGTAPQEPSTLLKAGRPYLWRFLGVHFLVLTALWFILGMIAAVYSIIKKQPGVINPPAWLIEPLAAAGMILLTKPFLLLPAFVVVLDLTIKNSFLHMMQVRLTHIGTLLKVSMAGFAAVAVIGTAASLVPEEGPAFYMAAGINCLAKSLNLLVLLLAAALWTAEVFLPPPMPGGEEN